MTFLGTEQGEPRKLMSDALTVMEKLAVYRHGINNGDLAEVRLAVKESLWLADLDVTPEEVARTVELLAEVQPMSRTPTEPGPTRGVGRDREGASVLARARALLRLTRSRGGTR